MMTLNEYQTCALETAVFRGRGEFSGLMYCGVPNTSSESSSGASMPPVLASPRSASLANPLVLSSMDRIEVISNAMELRGFGKNRKRTWYMGRKFRRADILCMAFCALLFALALILNAANGGRYWNPFISIR